MNKVLFVFFVLYVFFIKSSIAQKKTCQLFRGEKINCYDLSQRKEGKWIYFINGDTSLKIESEGMYISGRKTGAWKYWNTNSDFNSCLVAQYDSLNGINILLSNGADKIFIANDFAQIIFWDGSLNYIRTLCHQNRIEKCFDCLLFSKWRGVDSVRKPLDVESVLEDFGGQPKMIKKILSRE
ncbi:hypothetical protein ACTHGU_03595 [Chitinophagaceae bacterium MMS25-I14]